MKYKIKVPSTRVKTIETKFNVGDVVSIRDSESDILITPIMAVSISNDGTINYRLLSSRYKEDKVSLAE